MKLIINITLYCLALTVLVNCNSNNNITVQKENEKRLDLSFKVCSLKTLQTYLSKKIDDAKLDGNSKRNIDSLLTLQETTNNLKLNYLNDFEKLIKYSNHDAPFTSINYAQYYITKNYNGKFRNLLNQDSIYNYIGLYTPSHIISEIQSKSLDKETYLYLNANTKIVAEEFEIDWNALSLTEKIDLTTIVDAKFMVFFNNFFPSSSQNKPRNCGATCLKMICDYNGKYLTISLLETLTKTTDDGASFNDMIRASQELKLISLRHKINYKELIELNKLPLIANWNDDHFVVVYKIDNENIWVADPARGLRKYNKNEFCESWMYSLGKVEKKGRAVSFTPTKDFLN